MRDAPPVISPGLGALLFSKLKTRNSKLRADIWVRPRNSDLSLAAQGDGQGGGELHHVLVGLAQMPG